MIHADHIQEIARRLAEGFDPARIILFGSHARGDATEHSDVDVVVLFDAIDNKFQLEARMIAALRGIPVAIDIISFTSEEFELERQLPGTVANPAAAEGRVLYERAA